MSASHFRELLAEEGWIEETGGSFLEAWQQYWGKGLTTHTLNPHASWSNALRAKTRPTVADNALQQLAQAVFDPIHGQIALDPCSYIDTPWIDELPDTTGKIMLTYDYSRIHGQIETATNRRRGGVVIEGQSGIGKTHLAYYLLAQQLARGKVVMFSPCDDLYLLFLEAGVYRSKDLSYEFVWNLCSFNHIVPEGSWFITDSAHDGKTPPFHSVDDEFFSVQICSSRNAHIRWSGRKWPYHISFGTPSPYTVLSGAVIQTGVNSKRAGLVQILRHIHSFGPHPRLCYRSLSALGKKQCSLSNYLAELTSEQQASLSRLRARGDLQPTFLRAEGDPDPLAFYWNGSDEENSLVGIVSSRYVMGELRQHLDFDGFCSLRNMGSIQELPDGLHGARHWLFEHICHAVISEGRTRHEGRNICQLSQCHPLDIEPKDGGLLLEHILQPRTVHSYDDKPLPFDTTAYCIPQFLVDTSFNSITYAQPFAKRKATTTASTQGPVTRLAAKRAAQAAATSLSSERRLTRSAKRRLDDEAAAETSTRPPAKKPRLAIKKSDIRFVVFFQMVLRVPPDLTEALPRIQRIMDLNPSARHIMVFVTLSGESLDMNAIPAHWASRLFWYQLEIALDFPRSF